MTRSFGPWGWLFAAALVVAVFLVYQPAWQGGFLWDDDIHLLDNPVLKPGGLAKVWVPGGYLNYWPLTFTAYWLQFKIWGLNPLGFHLVNIAVHAISALLVWRILVQLRVPGAMFAAAIFALHPVNVESVAWITQLKGILSLLLALVSVLFFLAHERLGGWWRLALAIAAFWLSTLAKGMLITLPVVLLACAWWQRGRIERRDLLRVLPYLLIGAVMAGIEVWTQHRVAARYRGAFRQLLEPGRRGGLRRVVLPREADLAARPVFRLSALADRRPRRAVLFAGPALGDAARAGVVAAPYLGPTDRDAALSAYVALLLPALGFVNIYFMRYSFVADHYQYAAMIVPCAVFAGRGCHAGPTGALAVRPTGYVLGLALLAVLAVLSWRQSRMYADVETLYRTTIDRNPDCWMAHNNLGTVLAGRGQVDEAIAHYRKALEIKPDYAEAHNNLGLALAGRGQVDEAIAHYRQGPGNQARLRGGPLQPRHSPWPAADRSTRPSPITGRPWKSSPTSRRPTTTSASPWPAADRSTRPSPITGRPWKSSPTTPRPTTTSALPWPAADRSTRPSPITGRPWKSSPTTWRPTTTSAWPWPAADRSTRRYFNSKRPSLWPPPGTTGPWPTAFGPESLATSQMPARERTRPDEPQRKEESSHTAPVTRRQLHPWLRFARSRGGACFHPCRQMCQRVNLSGPGTGSSRRLWSVAVFLVYQPAWQGGLLWDDDFHVTRPELRSWHGLYRIWFDVRRDAAILPAAAQRLLG